MGNFFEDAWDNIKNDPFSAMSLGQWSPLEALGFEGGVSGLFGGGGGNNQDQEFWRSLQRNQEAWAPFRQEQQQAVGMQRDELMKALAAIQSGYGQAREQAGNIFQGERTAAKDRATKSTSQVSQNLAARGLGGTTYGANLQRGVQSDLNRSMERIGGQEASVYARLFPQQAAQEANIYGSLSNIYGQNLDRSMQTYLTQFEHVDPIGQQNPWWGLGGAALGGAIGGPAGAGIGSQFGSQFGSYYG